MPRAASIRQYSCVFHFTPTPADPELALGALAALQRWAQPRGLVFLGGVRVGTVAGHLTRQTGEGLRAQDRQHLLHWASTQLAGGNVEIGPRVRGALPRYLHQNTEAIAPAAPQDSAGVIVTMVLPSATPVDAIRAPSAAFVQMCGDLGLEVAVSASDSLTAPVIQAVRRRIGPLDGGEHYVTIFACCAMRDDIVRPWTEIDRAHVIEFGWLIGAEAQFIHDLTSILAQTPPSANAPVLLRAERPVATV